jgi:hypothetical protein
MEMHLNKAAGEMHQNYGGGHETAASHGGMECSTARVAARQESGPGDHAYLKKTFSQFMPNLRLGTCDTDGMEPEQDHYTPVSIHPGPSGNDRPSGMRCRRQLMARLTTTLIALSLLYTFSRVDGQWKSVQGNDNMLNRGE